MTKLERIADENRVPVRHDDCGDPIIRGQERASLRG